MLLQRMSLAFVAPSGVNCLSFMLLKERKIKSVISPVKNYQNSLKRALLITTTKQTVLAPFNFLVHPVIMTVIARVHADHLMYAD